MGKGEIRKEGDNNTMDGGIREVQAFTASPKNRITDCRLGNRYGLPKIFWFEL